MGGAAWLLGLSGSELGGGLATAQTFPCLRFPQRTRISVLRRCDHTLPLEPPVGSRRSGVCSWFADGVSGSLLPGSWQSWWSRGGRGGLLAGWCPVLQHRLLREGASGRRSPLWPQADGPVWAALVWWGLPQGHSEKGTPPRPLLSPLRTLGTEPFPEMPDPARRE